MVVVIRCRYYTSEYHANTLKLPLNEIYIIFEKSKGMNGMKCRDSGEEWDELNSKPDWRPKAEVGFYLKFILNAPINK